MALEAYAIFSFFQNPGGTHLPPLLTKDLQYTYTVYNRNPPYNVEHDLKPYAPVASALVQLSMASSSP